MLVIGFIRAFEELCLLRNKFKQNYRKLNIEFRKIHLAVAKINFLQIFTFLNIENIYDLECFKYNQTILSKRKTFTDISIICCCFEDRKYLI
ncbi:hypothetical protein BpHYR1_008892 [Brachionus plicatilis]|uniref:Uncharacterized protein n=1 Tax=Brachionus plicatilis TaxID=10195 RepID=A0A3M7T2C4_BRAPC|nr:hypothetical protein BpHYR1_008892 [Brachionus plicatilis]